jgi:hypothetical protein
VTNSPTVEEQIRHRGITRICHFTPSRNLVHIAAEGRGILSTAQLSQDERALFTQQDLARLDAHPEHISCSIQYPNAWYYASKRNPVGEGANFPDWVMLAVDPQHLARADTLYCQNNAGGGTRLEAGAKAFEGLYAAKVEDSKGRTFNRTPKRPQSCPTNDQAEAMIHQQIPLDDIKTIFVPDTAQAARVYVQLEQVGGDASRFRYAIAESFFNPYRMSAEIRKGVAPAEIPWNPPG